MHYRQLHELSALIADGDLTSTQITESVLARISRIDAHLGAFSAVLADSALAEAAQRDTERRNGRSRGPLHGVPVAVKDLYEVAGTPATAGTIALADQIATADSTAVERLRAAGAVIVGKLKMSEGAFAAHHPELGTPLNPWGEQLWTGASSSGNAAAVAAGLCYASLGSDTGGSIRFPSAATGTTGIKPTWGRVSRAGMVEFAGSLDCPGPMARSVRDCAVVYDQISGPDPRDPVTSARPRPNLTAACDRAEQVAAGARIGIDPAFMEVCDAQTRATLAEAVAVLGDLGATIVEVTLPSVLDSVADWTPACAVEAAIVHRRAYEAAPEKYGDQLRELIADGLAMPASRYHGILRRREEFTGRMRAALAGVDALVLQVTGTAAPTAQHLEQIGVGPIWRDTIMLATCPINTAGLPAVTLPGAPTPEGDPVGFQLVGLHDTEETLVSLAQAIQNRTDHHRRHPAAHP
ncbi:amidase [Stackebrandtia endophytica]|uniref:Amidase n=1 Tax=Stackebrandtia endophytica TaxID=1496996 RepID=A0A543ATJ8_9ACTN|nr:amidase [Stackebrandtia endophytica]TQL75898.1 amidase [Stackebrandtia endophytica]